MKDNTAEELQRAKECGPGLVDAGNTRNCPPWFRMKCLAAHWSTTSKTEDSLLSVNRWRTRMVQSPALRRRGTGLSTSVCWRWQRVGRRKPNGQAVAASSDDTVPWFGAYFTTIRPLYLTRQGEAADDQGCFFMGTTGLPVANPSCREICEGAGPNPRGRLPGTKEKELDLEDKTASLEHQVDADDPERAADVLLKISASYKEEAESGEALLEAVDAVLKTMLSASLLQSTCFLSTLLVHMGLLKGEGKVKRVPVVSAQLSCLTHAVQQPYFQQHHALLLHTVLCRNGKALKSCSSALEGLQDALKRRKKMGRK
ncbi:unnamed protein product [Arctogadus glacialis]